MAKKKVVILVSVLLVVTALIIIIAMSLYIKHTSPKDKQTNREENIQNGSSILTGEQCPCYRTCSSGHTCLTRDDCYNRHADAHSLDNLGMINCSAAVGYVCCPPVDPEINMRLLFDDCAHLGALKILGGEVAKLGQFPWMALLVYTALKSPHEVRYLCGGSLISTRYILTAAHCTNVIGYGEPIQVRLGEHDLSKEEDCIEDLGCANPPVDVEIEKIIAHEDFNDQILKNDIALLRLKIGVSLSQYTIPICLPFNVNMTDEEETKFIVAGWGKTSDHSLNMSDVLQYATVRNIPVSECDEAIPEEKVRPINELQLCAGEDGDADSCRGDSGGPLMKIFKNNNTATPFMIYQMGIVSFGALKCGTHVPSVYTRVSSYLRWILTNLEP